MFKNRLLMVLAALGIAVNVIWADVEINEENFPDDKFRIQLKTNKWGKDEIITDEEIASITKLDLEAASISNLTGIGYFTALDTLYVNANFLTGINLSNNTALKYLDCGGNDLTALDLSNNTALENLYCDGNKLLGVFLSNATALKNLYCIENPLNNIDLSNNTALEVLNCEFNKFTTLDLSKNTALKKLNCFSNKLTTLDVSKNTALENLECSYNELTSLDVSKNTALTNLNCYGNLLTELDVSGATALEILKCSDNKLASLDVSNNAALGSFNCDNNELTSLDVSNNTELTGLHCNNNYIPEENLPPEPERYFVRWVTLPQNEGSPVPITRINKPNGKMLFKSTIVSDIMEIFVNAECEMRNAELRIYDALGNVVYSANSQNGKFVWKLTNTAGRFVANGSYLVVVEGRDKSGAKFMWSEKLGVKR